MNVAKNEKPHILCRQAGGCGAYGQPGGAVGAIIPQPFLRTQGGNIKLSESKRHGPLPGCPSRQDMISAPVFMEQRGFTYGEWSIMVSLCDSDVEIRRYILAFAEECLNAWNGLAPSRGRFSYEIAAIAASNAYANARKEMRNYPKEYIGKLMEPPAPWSKEQTEEKMEAYFKNHPRRWRMTAKLHEALEQEAAAVYCEPYTPPSGCVIIPFCAADTAGKVVQQ